MTDIEFKILLNQRLCQLADELLYRYNPCKIDKVKKTCVGSADLDAQNCCEFYHYTKGDKCVFLKDGCTFENILCKLWLCDKAKAGADLMCLETMKLIKDIGRLHNILRNYSE